MIDSADPKVIDLTLSGLGIDDSEHHGIACVPEREVTHGYIACSKCSHKIADHGSLVDLTDFGGILVVIASHSRDSDIEWVVNVHRLSLQNSANLVTQVTECPPIGK